MLTVSIIIFAVTLLVLVACVGLKAWEVSHGTMLFSGARSFLDERVELLENDIDRVSRLADLVPGITASYARRMLHVAAVEGATFARALERELYRLADRVSHKHRFERTETKSAFLREVADGKNDLSTSAAGGTRPNVDSEAQ